MEAYSKEMQVCILIFQNGEEITVIAAKECRRRLDDILHGKYEFYCLVAKSDHMAVCIMQARLAGEQLMLHIHAN
jgi:hypothetical protein